MANVKITDLTAYTNPNATDDVLPIVDVGANLTKKISIENLLKNASSGTAAAPGFAFDGDSNTGIYSPGADQVAISTNGTGRLFIDSSGNVGVGTTSPVTKLDVAGNATVGRNAASGYRHLHFIDERENFSARFARISKNFDSPFDLRFYASTGAIPAPLCFNTTLTSEAARIDESGRLLVGTSSNSGGALLQVDGDRVRISTAKTPTSTSDTGTTGEVCWDADYIYVCTATNTWKRAPLSTW